MNSPHVLLSREELKEHSLKFLKSQELMVLGTSANNNVWSATVCFAVTDTLEIVFYSRPTTRHCENIAVNSFVSVVITDMPVKAKKEQSIQIAGEARQADGAEWNVYYPLFEKKHTWAKSAADKIIYVIKPNEIFMIDEGLLGHHNRVQVF